MAVFWQPDWVYEVISWLVHLAKMQNFVHAEINCTTESEFCLSIYI